MTRFIPPLLAFLILSTACPSWAAIALVQSTATTAANFNSTTIAYSSNVTAGDLVGTCGALWNGNSLTSIAMSDSVGTSYTVILGTIVTGGVPIKTYIAYGIAAGSGANTVTIDPNGTGWYGSHAVFEFSGVDSSPLDIDGGTSSGTSTSPADAFTTTDANTVGVGVVTHGNSGTITITEDSGGGWGLLGEVENYSNAPVSCTYQIYASAGAKSAGWTLGSSPAWAAQTAAFKQAASGANVSQFYRRRPQ